MDKNLTLKDIAQAAGVSVASVSRVVHGKPVRKETQEKVRAQIARTGYSPNMAARSLRTRSTRTIACAVRGLMNPVFLPVIQAIEASAREAGYRLILTSVDEDASAQRDAIRLLRAQGIDGLIFAGSAGQPSDLVADMGLPVVILDREPGQKVDCVNVAHGQGIKRAVHHLASLGHERIGLVTASPAILPGKERIQALEQALEELGLPFRPQYVRNGGLDSLAPFTATSELLNLADPPSAIISGGMAVLPGTLRAISAVGLKIGKDISLIAGCDSELAELATPAITAIRWNLSDWGRIATQMLLTRIENPDTGPGRYVCLPVELISRNSCAQLQATDIA